MANKAKTDVGVTTGGRNILKDLEDREALAAAETARGAALHEKIATEGGLCEIGDDGGSVPPARFDVVLRDGRVLLGCAIHGNGGIYRGDRALLLARMRVEDPRFSEDGTRGVLLYTVLRWFGHELIRVMPADIVNIDLHVARGAAEGKG